MNQSLKESALDWIRILEDVSAAAVSEMNKWHTLGITQTVQLDLLFRSYWLGDLEYRIRCADTWNENARWELRKMVRDRLFDSAFRPLETPQARGPAHRFLNLCSRYNLYQREDMFNTLLGKILCQKDVTVPAASARKIMESRMADHIFERRHKNHNSFGWPKRPDPDDPPPGMDEFESIDWIISH